MKLESVCQPLLRGTQETAIKALSMHGRCVMGVIEHLVGRAAHRAGLVADPVSKDCGELACVSNQGDRSWHAWVRRASRVVLLRNAYLVPRSPSQAAFFVVSRAPDHAAACTLAAFLGLAREDLASLARVLRVAQRRCLFTLPLVSGCRSDAQVSQTSWLRKSLALPPLSCVCFCDLPGL